MEPFTRRQGEELRDRERTTTMYDLRSLCKRWQTIKEAQGLVALRKQHMWKERHYSVLFRPNDRRDPWMVERVSQHFH